jgi:Uma2 family endonuclease
MTWHAEDMRTVTTEVLPAVPLRLRSKALLDDDAYFAFCMENPDIGFERMPNGDIVVGSPAGGKSDYRSALVAGQLWLWTKRKRNGGSFGSSIEFILPTRAALSPAAAWVSKKRLDPISDEAFEKFLRVAPEFVVEVLSPSDRLRVAQAKMRMWIAGGVDLAWLIDGQHQTVYIYRRGQAKPEKRQGLLKLAGEGPVAGFTLDLREIWRGRP